MSKALESLEQSRIGYEALGKIGETHTGTTI